LADKCAAYREVYKAIEAGKIKKGEGGALVYGAFDQKLVDEAIAHAEGGEKCECESCFSLYLDACWKAHFPSLRQ
jgi:hypothetical protein